MPPIKTIAASLSALALTFGLAIAPAQADLKDTTIDVLAFTDLHGYLAQAKDKTGAVTQLGVQSLNCQIQAVKQANPNTTVVSIGDNIGASTWLSAASHDNPTIAAMNEMGVTVSAVGNHEFDNGLADLKSRIAGGPRMDFDGNAISTDNYVKPNFKYLGANAKGTDLAAYDIQTIDGVKVAFIGAVTDNMPNLVPAAGIQGITWGEPAAAINDVAAQLRKDKKADVIIGLTHEDAANQVKLIGKDVDALIGGHSHVEYVDENAQGRDGQKITAIQPSNYGQRLGQLTINIQGGKVEVKAKNLGPSELAADCLTAQDADLKTILSAAQTTADTEGKKPVAKIGSAFYRGTFVNATGGSGENRGTSSTAVNLVAEAGKAWAEKLPNPENLPIIGVANAGGTRADLIPDANGMVNYEQVRAVAPFAGTKAYVDIPGSAVYELLEQQWKKPDAQHPMLKLGLSKNVTYSFESPDANGKRIYRVYVDGKLVEKDKYYRFAGDKFVLDGGDGFEAFRKGKPVNDSGVLDLSVLIDYLKEQEAAGTPAKADYVTRAIKIDAPNEIKPGSVSAFNLAGLGMTADSEPRPKTVTAKIGDQIIGTGTIGYDKAEAKDAALNSGVRLGEFGKSKLSLNIPRELGDITEINFYTDLSGTEAIATVVYMTQSAKENAGQPDTPRGEVTKDMTIKPADQGGKDKTKPTQMPKTGQGVDLLPLLTLVAAATVTARASVRRR